MNQRDDRAPESASEADRLDRARTLFARSSSRFEPITGEVVAFLKGLDCDGEPEAACYLEQALALVALRSGALAEAGGAARRAVQHATSSLVSSDARGHARVTLIAVLSVTGPETEFRASFTAALVEEQGPGRVRLLSNVGVAEMLRGRTDAAAPLLEEALLLLAEDDARRGSVENNLAVLRLLQGRLDEAEAFLAGAARHATESGNAVGAAVASSNRALVELARGNIATGLDRFERAQLDVRSHGLDPTPAELDRCKIVLDLGLVDEAAQVGMGLLRGAIRLPERAAAISSVTTALVLAGEWGEARSLVDSPGVEPLLEVHDGLRRNVQFVRLVTGTDAGSQAGTAPLPPEVPGLPELAAIADAAGEGALDRAGRLASVLLAGPYGPAATGLASALQRCVRAALDTDLPAMLESVRSCQQIIARGGVAEMALARVWFDRIERLGFATAESIDDADAGLSLVDAGRRIAGSLGSWSRAVIREIEPLERERRALSVSAFADVNEAARTRRIEALEHRIATRLATVTPAGDHSGIGHRRSAGQAAPAGPTVIYRSSRGQLVALVKDAGPLRFVRLGPLAEIMEHVAIAERAAQALLLHRTTRSNVLARSWRSAAARLDETLLQPLGLRASSLTVLACAEVASVTWGVLPSLRGVDVRLADGLDPDAAPRFDAQDPVLLVGGPELQHVSAELDAAAAWWHRTQRLEASTATAERTLGAFSATAVAHVGAHGRVRSDAPLFSHLSLADGPMTLGDVHRADRLPRSIVLSACHLGGGYRRMRPTWPVASALSGRECRSLVVSVLPVADRSSIAFMSRFHEDLAAGHTPPAALARAHADAIERDDYGCIGFVEMAIGGPTA